MPTTSLAERMLLVVVHSQTPKENRTRGNFMASPTTENKKALPQPNSDFYQLLETLPADELAVVKQVRTFMETKVAPIITKYWSKILSRLNCCPRSRNSISAAWP